MVRTEVAIRRAARKSKPPRRISQHKLGWKTWLSTAHNRLIWTNQDFIPWGSMYGILTYIWLIFMVNVGKYTIHGSSGIVHVSQRFSRGRCWVGFNDLSEAMCFIQKGVPVVLKDAIFTSLFGEGSVLFVHSQKGHLESPGEELSKTLPWYHSHLYIFFSNSPPVQNIINLYQLAQLAITLKQDIAWSCFFSSSIYHSSFWIHLLRKKVFGPPNMYGCFLNGSTPKTPPKWSFLVGNPMITPWLLGTTILGNPHMPKSPSSDISLDVDRATEKTPHRWIPFQSSVLASRAGQQQYSPKTMWAVFKTLVV